MTHNQRNSLKIGYLWQYETVDMSTVSASVLHVKAVIEGFEKRAHQVRLVTFHQGRISWSEDRINWQPADLGKAQSRPFRFLESGIRGLQSRLHLPFLRLFDSYRFSEACLSALKDFDILYERHWFMGSGGLIAAKHLGIPLIYEVNGDLVEEYAQLGLQLSKAQWAAIYFVNRLMFWKASRLVAVSETLRNNLLRRWHLKPNQISVVRNGARVDLFAEPAESESTLREYGVGDEPMIMFVGSFKPWHGIDLLIDAFSCVVRTQHQAKLFLVGDGPARSELEEKVRALGFQERVIFTGMIPHQDVALLLNKAQVAIVNPRVSPASSAQSPLKLFEYMAAGKAIVAPAIPNVESVLAHRKNALLVSPDNMEALAEALIELLASNELRLRLGRAARQEVLEKHSWNRVVSELEAIMYELLDNSKKQIKGKDEYETTTGFSSYSGL